MITIKTQFIAEDGRVFLDEKEAIEYDALAREIDDAYEKMGKNEIVLQKEVRTKKTELTESFAQLQKELDDVNNELKEKQEELTVLKKQTEDEETELNKQRKELVAKISPDDFDFYERINIAKPGDAVAIVRKGSCLGCYNSIPPQRVIEFKMADRAGGFMDRKGKNLSLSAYTFSKS